MNTLETEIDSIYQDVRHQVGRKYNRAFVPHAMSTLLAQQLSQHFHTDISDEHFLPAFWLKEALLYPDAEDFLAHLGALNKSIIVMFTQGEVYDHGLRGDVDNLGFQNLKIEAAGIPWYVGSKAMDRLRRFQLDFVQGGYCKTDCNTLDPLARFVLETGMQVHYFDDVVENLVRVNNFFANRNIDGCYYQVQRGEVKNPDQVLPKGIRRICGFEEFDVQKLENSLVMIDYDGTVGDSQHMREYLHNEFIKSAMRLTTS